MYGFEIILHPAGQENKAFLINPGFVARINPTIAKGFGRFLRVLVISGGKPCCPCQQLPLFADTHFHITHYLAYRADLAVLVGVGRKPHSLGLTEALHQIQTELAIPFNECRWGRRRRGEQV